MLCNAADAGGIVSIALRQFGCWRDALIELVQHLVLLVPRGRNLPVLLLVDDIAGRFAKVRQAIVFNL